MLFLILFSKSMASHHVPQCWLDLHGHVKMGQRGERYLWSLILRTRGCNHPKFPLSHQNAHCLFIQSVTDLCSDCLVWQQLPCVTMPRAPLWDQGAQSTRQSHSTQGSPAASHIRFGGWGCCTAWATRCTHLLFLTDEGHFTVICTRNFKNAC